MSKNASKSAEAAAAENEEFTPVAVSPEKIEDILANPEKYGIGWTWDWVPQRGAGKDKVQLRNDPAPLLIMTDLDKFSANFGKQHSVDAYNGTSPKVRAQAIIRTEIEKNRKVSDADLQRAVIRSLLFSIRRPGSGGGTRTIFVDPVTGKQYKSLEDLKAAQAPETYKSDMLGGEVFKTLLEKQQAEIAHMTKFGLTLEQAKKALNIG